MKKRVGQVWAGRLNTSIPVLLGRVPGLLSRFPFALITSIDSSRDLRELRTGNEIVARFEECRLLGGAITATGETLLAIIEQGNVFNGFDEVWLFPNPPSKPIPAGIWITPPLEITKEMPTGLPEWMRQSACSMGLGDGIGLNYVTGDPSVADFLEQQDFGEPPC